MSPAEIMQRRYVLFASKRTNPWHIISFFVLKYLTHIRDQVNNLKI
jgi:hypothetical protein